MKIIQLCIIILLFGQALLMSAQNEGDQWLIGYTGFGEQNYTVQALDFGSGEIKVIQKPNIFKFISETCSNLQLPNDGSILWTNGMQFGVDNFILDDSIGYDNDPVYGYWNWFVVDHNYPRGYPKVDGSLILAIDDTTYSLINHLAEFHPNQYFLVSTHLHTEIVRQVNGVWKINFSDSIFSNDKTWFTNPMKAVRHGNGRDWWIVSFEADSKISYTYLLTKSGISIHRIDTTASPIQAGLGQASFSFFGNYVARMDAISLDKGQFITLYSFDRCSGELKWLETIHTQGNSGSYTGLAFSPNERFLYADDNFTLRQWDLLSPDISSSEIIVDTFDHFIEPGWFGTRFGPMGLAPDGRIYIVPSNASSRRLHVIDRPNLEGSSSRFIQHKIELPGWNARSVPNIPNYRLGPLDGSPCDTLGLDNHPVSWWRYEEDEPGLWKTIRFTDLSYFDPHTWHWDFDDGTTSDEQHPVHTFEPGIYHVCLTVSNEYDTDSTCQWIEILTTDIKEAQALLPDISIDPNPFQDQLIIRSRSGHIRTAHMQLFDMHGRIVYDNSQTPVPATIHMPPLPSGMYFCNIREKNGVQFSFKLMKLEGLK